MGRLRVMKMGLFVILTGLVIASCSSNPSGPNPGPGPNGVSIAGLAFNPPGLNVKTGTKVTWTNNDNVTHTVTSDNGGFTSSGNLGPGSSYSVTFTTAGSFSYHCTIHPTMKGTINVTP
jgi:plastocyanin